MCVVQEVPRPEPCDETLIINELIREYLVWHGLRDTLSVFIPGVHKSLLGGGQGNKLPLHLQLQTDYSGDNVTTAGANAQRSKLLLAY